MWVLLSLTVRVLRSKVPNQWLHNFAVSSVNLEYGFRLFDKFDEWEEFLRPQQLLETEFEIFYLFQGFSNQEYSLNYFQCYF